VPNNQVADPVTGFVPCYDIAGNLLFQHSMDAGDRWMINDAAGKPMLAWDMNETPQGTATTRENRVYTTDYDKLHRPTAQWLTINNVTRIMVERYEYQDAVSPDVNNLNGQLTQHYDPSGLVETIRRDFKGNVQEVHRTLTGDATVSVVDWNVTGVAELNKLLEQETYAQLTEHDALNRMTRLYNWHRDITFNSDGTQRNMPGSTNRVAVYVPEYNERGSLRGEWLHVRASKTTDTNGVVTFTPDATRSNQAIKHITYNAKGQKELLKLGNDTITRYDYDEKTFRLRQLRTTRPAYDPPFPQPHSILADGNILQQLLYTYDPVGNITELADEAYKPVYFANGIAEPKSQYEYDALYRLIFATGRETAQGGDAALNGDEPAIGSGFPINDQTLRRYEQIYVYDKVGNFVTMQHSVPTDTTAGWTRHYDTQLDSNRLHRTWYRAPDWDHAAPVQRTEYGYDTHGNMLNLANVAPGQHLQWDHRDMIKSLDCIGGGVAYYQYDSAKQRTRKRIVKQNGYWERLDLGGYERYRRYNGTGSTPTLMEEIESHHLFEGKQRVLLVDDVLTAKSTTQPGSNGLGIKKQTLFRYQYSNHLGSACLELDHNAGIISYEEYHPYGTSAYRAMASGIEAPPKRYRFTGKERDEETDFVYHGARYYVAWLGRWGSCDPIGIQDGVNQYLYVSDKPTKLIDAAGMSGGPSPLGNSVDDVVDFETRQAAFEAGKALEKGFDPKKQQPVFASQGGKPLPPPTGKQLEELAKNTPEGKNLRTAYGSKQGGLSGEKLQQNLAERSQAAFDKSTDVAHFGDTSGRLVPELTLEEGVITKVNTAPGGQTPGARTVDVGVTKEPVSPSDWKPSLEGKNAPEVLSETRDLKVSNSYVEHKPAFLEQSGGVSVTESRPWSKLKAKASATMEAVTSNKTVEKVLKSKALKVVATVAPILASGVAKAAPLVGTLVGAADVANEVQAGDSRRATLTAVGMSEIPFVSQAADIGLAVEDAGWAAKEILDPEEKLEEWYLNAVLK
jgi:RHS repeat-associated protein